MTADDAARAEALRQIPDDLAAGVSEHLVKVFSAGRYFERAQIAARRDEVAEVLTTRLALPPNREDWSDGMRDAWEHLALDGMTVAYEHERAIVQRVEALADRWAQSGPLSARLAADDLRAALHPEEPHAPAQEAGSMPDGPEGVGFGPGRERGRYATGRALLEESALLTTCGDRLTTWHGPIGPCVLTGRHTLHDDGEGTTWSRTNVPDLTGEPS